MGRVWIAASVAALGMAVVGTEAWAQNAHRTNTVPGSEPGIATVNNPVLSGDIFSGSIEPAVTGDPNHEAGLSYYSNMARFGAAPTTHTQFGWDIYGEVDDSGGTWPQCPRGTALANAHFFVQSLEGGPGQIDGDPFPAALPKFKINGTPDCYNTQVGSVPFEPSLTAAFQSNRLGLAQLSNRLLVPPDGFTVASAPQEALLGTGWAALPLIPAGTSAQGLPTGNQSWALFLNSANFAGPVAFYVPPIWTSVDLLDLGLEGFGFDAMPVKIGGQGMEVGHIPTYAGVDAQGIRYRRAPQIAFPTAADGHALFLQDEVSFDRTAIWDGFAAWMAGGSAPTSFVSSGVVPVTVPAGWGYDPANAASYQPAPAYMHIDAPGATSDEVVVPDAVMVPEWVPAPKGGIGLGIHGVVPNADGQATFPEYFKEVSGRWVAIPAAQVPPETGLLDVSFPVAENVSPGVPTQVGPRAWAAGPYVVRLLDGSAVEYVWYRFVDQPAIQQLQLSAGALQSLQSFVTTLHRSWGVNGVTIPPPTSGALATLDPALIVTPPAGLAAGYVPVAVGQFAGRFLGAGQVN
jgi:hypothetical protein